MERSSQPSRPECCRQEGQAYAAQQGGSVEQPAGGVHREIHEPQAGVAPRLSNTASKRTNAGEDTVLSVELKTARAATGEARAGLPGSESVAREQSTVRNQGDPVISRCTNYEGQAGRDVRRQEGQTDGEPGVGSLHSSAGQSRASGTDVREGSDRTTQPAQATSAVRMTEQSWQTFLRATADKAQNKLSLACWYEKYRLARA